MSIKWKINYTLAAVIAAVVVIAVALVANPLVHNPSSPNQASPAAFLVMLTDPPTVPAGTTVLDLTYTNISLHVTYPNETEIWLPVNASGTVNLLSLVNMSQTLASTDIPTGSTVDKIQFGIADVTATVNGNTYNVTSLSNTITIKIDDSQVNQTFSGVLVDFNPTLVQIQAQDANGTATNYYVLVPSAVARIVGDLHEEQARVGTVVELGEHHKAELDEESQQFSNNVTISSASLSVNGNLTTISVTLKNEGNSTFRVFGLTLHGQFNSTGSTLGGSEDQEINSEDENANRTHNDLSNEAAEQVHSQTIPFKLNGTSLIPLFGTDQEHEDEHEQNQNQTNASLTLQPGQEITLTFSGVISLQTEEDHIPTVIIPIANSTYTLRLMGEGFQTFNVTATSP